MKVALLLFTLVLSACSTRSHPITDNPIKNERLAAQINTELALVYLERGDHQRAKEKLLQAQRQSPKDPMVFYGMGYFYESSGEINQARAHYLRAIQLAPDKGAPKNNYGTFLCRQGEYRAGIEQFSLAAADPGYLETAEAYENAGLCAREIPDIKLAETYFNEALARNPNKLKSLAALREIQSKS